MVKSSVHGIHGHTLELGNFLTGVAIDLVQDERALTQLAEPGDDPGQELLSFAALCSGGGDFDTGAEAEAAVGLGSGSA